MKIGDKFWEVNVIGINNTIYYCYPRFIHTIVYIDYYNRQLGKWAFPTKEEAEKRVEELNKSIDNLK